MKRHLKPGTLVILNEGIREGGRHWNRGIVARRDGEYYDVRVFVGDETVTVERYLTELKERTNG